MEAEGPVHVSMIGEIMVLEDFTWGNEPKFLISPRLKILKLPDDLTRAIQGGLVRDWLSKLKEGDRRNAAGAPLSWAG
jgi:hypothetical protein